MKLYNIKLRVGGELFTEVRKNDVTAAEIGLLSFLHKGSDCIVECNECGSVKRTDRAERKRLAATYSYGDLDGPTLVQRLFGTETMPLPQDYEAPADEVVEDAILVGDEDVGKEEIVRTVLQAPAVKMVPLRAPNGRIIKPAAVPEMLT